MFFGGGFNGGCRFGGFSPPPVMVARPPVAVMPQPAVQPVYTPGFSRYASPVSSLSYGLGGLFGGMGQLMNQMFSYSMAMAQLNLTTSLLRSFTTGLGGAGSSRNSQQQSDSRAADDDDRADTRRKKDFA
jgi:hypothetical protein